jgi:hypothetical protein
MDLHKYLQYAAVTSPIVLVIIFLSLTFKSWLDRRAFIKNLVFANYFQQKSLQQWMDEPFVDFDKHVESTPGMQNFS